MNKPTDTGTNRTGIATSPIDSPKLIQGAEIPGVTGQLDGKVIEAERALWSRDADPIGTVPPPGTLKGVAKTILEKLQGHKPTVFIDKLGARLAFERTGTRLYDAILAKFDAAHPHEGGPTREELERFRQDEHRHMLIVRDAIEFLGADPTAMTPCADIVGVAGLGWVQVLSDPRTTLTQGLDIILMAELADVDGWHVLIELAEGLGFDDLVQQCRTAHVEEEEHLMRVRSWIASAVVGQAGISPTPPQPTAPSAA